MVDVDKSQYLNMSKADILKNENILNEYLQYLKGVPRSPETIDSVRTSLK